MTSVYLRDSGLVRGIKISKLRNAFTDEGRRHKIVSGKGAFCGFRQFRQQFELENLKRQC